MTKGKITSAILIAAPSGFSAWNLFKLNFAFYTNLEDLPAAYAGQPTRVTTKQVGCIEALAEMHRFSLMPGTFPVHYACGFMHPTICLTTTVIPANAET